MLCAVYKSKKQQDAYLYVPTKGDFSAVPEALLKSLGSLHFVMLIPLNKPRKIGLIDSEQLQQEFAKQGFYLQISRHDEDLLALHRQSLGLGPTPDIKF